MWSNMTRSHLVGIVKGFLESYDFTGKTMIPSAPTPAAGWEIPKVPSPKLPVRR